MESSAVWFGSVVAKNGVPVTIVLAADQKPIKAPPLKRPHQSDHWQPEFAPRSSKWLWPRAARGREAPARQDDTPAACGAAGIQDPAILQELARLVRTTSRDP
ncbi:MAG: hypothetical protein LBT38_00520 [Deltaproteobacteria bacterium]|nr:hypothetical protein [Deltaproteobacteria bacterium]